MVRGAADSADHHPPRPSLLDQLCFARACAKPVLCWSYFWNRGGLFRRNWLDGLRISQNDQNRKPARSKLRPRRAVGMLAYPGDRLPGNRNATQLLLVAVFPGIHGSHDGNACADWLDLREHRKCSPDRKSTRLNSSHSQISYAVFCLKKKN